MFGTGVVLLQLSPDVSFGAVPLSLWQAKAMLERTRAGRLLAGYRGAPGSDTDSVLAAMMALGRLAHDLGEPDREHRHQSVHGAAGPARARALSMRWWCFRAIA